MAAMVNGTVPHGMKAIRHMRGKKQPSERQRKKINDTYEYFLEKVDPVVGACITHMLCTQPSDILVAMIEFLALYKSQSGRVESESLISAHKPRKELRLYLATSIGPVVSKLVNRVAAVQPHDVIDFMCVELESMKEEDSLNPDRAELKLPTTAHSQTTVKNSSKQAVYATIEQVPESVEPSTPPKNIQIAIVGLDGAGKSSVINMLTGSYEHKTRPTIGFRPFSMAMGKDMVRFYDLGGGKKIRDIWEQYYHDVHGVIYVVDAAVDTKEHLEVFEATMGHRYLDTKPVLILANKQDLPGALDAAKVGDMMDVHRHQKVKQVLVHECSSHVPETVDDNFRPDGRIEAALEALLGSIVESYDLINAKVLLDVRQKAVEEARKRIERERKVLKNKIASAFCATLAPAVREALGAEEDAANVFEQEEGLTFLAAEIGEESASALPDIAADIARMTGYQRLALQIIGALKAPISKKKVPMNWDEIHQLIRELRIELQLEEQEEV